MDKKRRDPLLTCCVSCLDVRSEATPESGGRNRPELAIDVSLTSLAAATLLKLREY